MKSLWGRLQPVSRQGLSRYSACSAPPRDTTSARVQIPRLAALARVTIGAALARVTIGAALARDDRSADPCARDPSLRVIPVPGPSSLVRPLRGAPRARRPSLMQAP